MNNNSRRYVWSNISLVIDDLNHSIRNWLNYIVKHITSLRIWTFTVLQSLALHTAGQRPLEGLWAVVTVRPLWPWLQRIQFTTNLPVEMTITNKLILWIWLFIILSPERMGVHCASKGFELLWRCCYTVSSQKVLLTNAFTCVSWGWQL